MSVLDTNNTAFFIIDIQEKLLNAVFNKETVGKNSEILAKTAKILSIPTIVTEQYPQGLGETVSVIKTNLPDTAKYFVKTAFNALCDEDLCKKLQELNIKNVVISGIETHICVYQTVIAILQKGYSVTVIKNCCGSRCEAEYQAALDCMQNNGAEIKTTEMVLFELLKTAKHPNFKEIQSLIK